MRHRAVLAVAAAAWAGALVATLGDREATALDRDLGGASQWRITSVAPGGVTLDGPSGVRSVRVADGVRVTASVGSAQQRRVGVHRATCRGFECDGVFLSADSGAGIEEASTALIGTEDDVALALLGPPGSRAEVLHSSEPGDMLALVWRRQSVDIVQVGPSEHRTVATAGGPGAHVVASPNGLRLAVRSGLTDGGVGLDVAPRTHWLHRVGGEWAVERDDSASPLCLGDDGSAVVAERGGPRLRRADGSVATLDSWPGETPNTLSPCVVSDEGVVAAGLAARKNVHFLEDGHPTEEGWVVVWSRADGSTERVVTLRARRVAVSPRGDRAAAITADNRLITFDRSGVKRDLPLRAVDSVFLASGDLVAVSPSASVSVFEREDLE